ncbi:histidinol-phosphate transaminase [Lysobacter xanthus]
MPAYDEAWFASRATAGIAALRAYDPGHDVVAMRGRTQWLVELGSNENPYGPSPRARAAVLDALHLMHRYPDPRGASLKAALASRLGVDARQILLGNGSHELLMQLAQVFAGPGDEVVAPQYGFAVFALAAQAAGATLRIAPALAADAAMPRGHDADALLAAITPATRLVYIANPNNPTGTWLDRDTLVRFLSQVPPQVIVVVDEAYAELADAPTYASALAVVRSQGNVVVTRTFSKAYALAGLRCGYAVAAEGLVAVMERVRESFNVNGLALAACEAALGDTEHLEWSRARNAEQRATLAEALCRRGLHVAPSQTNFLLVEFGESTPTIESALLERGVILRPMGGYGLPRHSRVTVGTADENRRLLAALDEVLS